MAQSLDQFVDEQTDALQEFKRYWEEQNKANSEQFPIEMPAGQEGLWIEMFLVFQEDK